MTTAQQITVPARRKNGGRPSKFNWRLVRRVIRSAERGMPLCLCAAGAGISHQSLIMYRKQHPKFDAAVQKAIARGIQKRLEKIEKASDSGDWRASAWLLEHCPGSVEHYAKNRVEVTGVGGAALTVGVAIYLPQKDGTLPATIVDTKKEIEYGNEN